MKGNLPLAYAHGSFHISRFVVSELAMKQDGYMKVIEGVTTIEEVLRVAQEQINMPNCFYNASLVRKRSFAFAQDDMMVL